jgi:two-component system LytT family response regulator
MRIIIVEDEHLAAERLADLLQQYDPAIAIAATLDSIEETVEWLAASPPPDLGFFDIQLADGLSFSIFEQVRIDFPVVFTTAFDQYALKAFEVNSIDYLLKPIDREALARAFRKYSTLKGEVAQPALDIRVLQDTLQMLQGSRTKERFVVKKGPHLISIPTSDILYFFSENKQSWARTPDGRKHAVDYTLEQLEHLLDDRFFRLNRQYLVSLKGIQKATAYSNSRLRVHLVHAPADEKTIVSRDKVQSFRQWFAGE